MKYVLAKNHITKPEHSVDGRLHRRTLYFSGSTPSPLGDVECWGYRKDAKVYEANDGAAKAHARMFGEECYPLAVKA